jgi:hypothetical protein
MPRAALGLAVLVISGAITPVIAQSTPSTVVVGKPVLSTSLPPDPVLSTSLPPEPSLETTPVLNLPRVLGTPVVSPDTGTIRPVGGNKDDSPAITDPNLPVTPVPNNNTAPKKPRAAVLGIQTPDGAIVSPPGATATFSQPPEADPNDFLRKRAVQRVETDTPTSPTERSSDKFGGAFGEKLDELLGKRNEWFKSDHAFDGFISPVTNPFLFEDPRSLTEVRPIFIAEKIPNSEPDFRGGNVIFFGTQLRLAITDRLSFVINKFGFESVNPGSGSEFHGDTGFAEFWFGPKYTFIRGENTGTLLAGGIQFQIPTGDHSNFQDTGSLSLVPYVSFAQSFLRDWSPGSFNTMVNTGYSFSVNNERSDYYYLSAHLDMNVLHQNHWFPLIEMNWFTYTTNGKSLPIGVEGQDLINFGGQARGQGLLTMAFGTRYKFNEHYELGGAFEIPIAGPHDINAYRFTLDAIFRY